MPSFDSVLEPNLVEVKNAVDQTAQGDRHPLRLQGHVGPQSS